MRPKRAHPSIALRMTVFYAISVSLLIFAAVTALYLVLDANLEREDERTEIDVVSDLRVILGDAPDAAALREVRAAHRQVFVRLFNPDGSIRRETPGMSRIVPPPPPAILQALPPDAVESEIVTPAGRTFETQTARLAWDGSPRAGFAQVTMDRSHEKQLLAIYRRRMVLVLGLAVLTTLVAGHLMARASMRPIRRIGAAAAQVGSSNLHERIPLAGLPVELWSLVQAFNTMLDRLEDAFARISKFSDDVAHELRTPLHNMRGELEVAISRARSPEQYREALSSALEESERLSRIVRSLSFLARADERAALQREDIDVGRELEVVREFYEAAAQEQGVALNLDVEPGLRAQLDHTLFQQAVGNLVSNAIEHTPSGGEIWLRAKRDDGALRLEVSDNGCGVTPEHLPHVFERFYRADPARGGGHVGLGLAVVRSIVERHGGQASMESAPGGGARVELILPS
jgi:two-component system heavy metal sensor histidine kinase CusS